MSFNHCCLLAKRVSSEYDVRIIGLLLASKLYIFANSSLVQCTKSITYLIDVISLVEASGNLNELLIFHNGAVCSGISIF